MNPRSRKIPRCASKANWPNDGCFDPINLTIWPYANVIAPSKVQVLVDAAGNVVSAVLLPPDSGFTAADQYDKADQRALELARAARFAPASRLTVGRMIFNWHTVPPPATNAPAIP